jgi:hypothetical protein
MMVCLRLNRRDSLLDVVAIAAYERGAFMNFNHANTAKRPLASICSMKRRFVVWALAQGGELSS